MRTSRRHPLGGGSGSRGCFVLVMAEQSEDRSTAAASLAKIT